MEWLVAGLGLLAVLCLAQPLWGLFGSQQVAADRGQQAFTLAGVATQNRDEVSRLGGTPIGPDPATILRGDPGRDGATGATGAPGRDGAVGPVGPSGRAGPSGPAGPTGPPGPAGAAGDTVPGPAGPQGPEGQRGQPGTDGRDGTDGAIPAVLHVTYPDGTRWFCQLDQDTPVSEPAYHCQQEVQ